MTKKKNDRLAHISEVVEDKSLYRAYLHQVAKGVTNKEVGQMAKGRLIGMIENQQEDPRILVQALRMGLEVSGEIGAGKDLTVKHQIEVPAAAQEMIARRIMELQAAVTVEAEDAAGTGS